MAVVIKDHVAGLCIYYFILFVITLEKLAVKENAKLRWQEPLFFSFTFYLFIFKILTRRHISIDYWMGAGGEREKETSVHCLLFAP